MLVMGWWKYAPWSFEIRKKEEGRLKIRKK
jgi:hypothetical protein